MAAWIGSVELMLIAEREGADPHAVSPGSSPNFGGEREWALETAACQDLPRVARAWLGMSGVADPRAACERALAARPERGWGGSGEVESLLRAFALAREQRSEIAASAPPPDSAAPRRRPPGL